METMIFMHSHAKTKEARLVEESVGLCKTSPPTASPLCTVKLQWNGKTLVGGVFGSDPANICWQADRADSGLPHITQQHLLMTLDKSLGMPPTRGSSCLTEICVVR